MEGILTPKSINLLTSHAVSNILDIFEKTVKTVKIVLLPNTYQPLCCWY